MSVQLDAAFNYNDLQGLETLKSGARKDDPQALKAVAQQFESMFLSLIMKSMREATDVMASDLENSYQTKFYRDMHDQQMSLSLSQNGGFGLAEVLYEQLSEAQNGVRFNPYDIDVKSLKEFIRPQLPVTQMPLSQIDSDTQALIDKISTRAASAEFNVLREREAELLSQPDTSNKTLNSEDVEAEQNSYVTSQASKGSVFASPEDFVNKVLPVAEKVAKELGVNPRVIVAQAALETGWGQFVIQKESGESSFNFFGIKADHRWNGDAAMTTTHEFIAGKKLTVKAPFRAYDSIEESFQDYANFLKNSDRYQQALSAAENEQHYVSELQKAGYATDPKYAEKILRIANSDWLQQV